MKKTKKSKKAHFPADMNMMVEDWMKREVPHLLVDEYWKDIFKSCWLDVARRHRNHVDRLEKENGDLKEEVRLLKEGKVEKRYYLVTMHLKALTTDKLYNMLLSENPVDWYVGMLRNLPNKDRGEYTMVNYMEISKKEYEKLSLVDL